MALKAPVTPDKLKLSPLVTGSVGVVRLLRELEDINSSLLQASLRSGRTATKMPPTSYLMDEIIRLNKLNLLRKTDRAALDQYLKQLHSQAPVMHISFGAVPSPEFVEKLVTWLRREIHPAVLVTIGLQPGLGVGCVLRTTNKYFDLSLRQGLIKQRNLLKAELLVRGAG